MIIFQSKLYCTEVLKVITTMKNKLANEHCTPSTHLSFAGRGSTSFILISVYSCGPTPYDGVRTETFRITHLHEGEL